MIALNGKAGGLVQGDFRIPAGAGWIVQGISAKTAYLSCHRRRWCILLPAVTFFLYLSACKILMIVTKIQIVCFADKLFVSINT